MRNPSVPAAHTAVHPIRCRGTLPRATKGNVPQQEMALDPRFRGDDIQMRTLDQDPLLLGEG